VRIRTIKPEFWDSESVGRLSRDARLLFIGLWNLADDSGRLRGTLPKIRGSLLSYDDVSLEQVGKWLDELIAEKMVRRYQGDDGNTYLDIPNWLKHQRLDHPSESKLPAFREDSGTPPENFGLEQGTGNREGNREQGPMDQGGEQGLSPAAIESDGPMQTLEKELELARRVAPPAGYIPRQERAGMAHLIYNACRKKVGKPEALIAIEKALVKPGITAEYLLERTQLHYKMTEGMNLRYIPNPARWFTEERFNDDPATWKQDDDKKEPAFA
jgi:hypothetical protein